MKSLGYIGTYSARGSRGIYLVEVDIASSSATDSDTNALTILDAFQATNPSYLTKRDGVLYVALETSQWNGQYGGAVASYAIAEDGRLTQLSELGTGGTSPCYVSVSADGGTLYAANYSDGKLSRFGIDAGGRLTGPQILQHEGHGPNSARQEGPHAHCAVETPDGRVCVVDLGLDTAMLYRREGGALVSAGALRTPPGSGPRHIVFSADGRFAWIVCEMGNEVAAFRMSDGECLGIYPMLPPDFAGVSTAAAIKLSPDGKFLYASNRGHDSIAAFEVNEDGTLRLRGIVSARGETPRDLALAPGGRFLYAANQDSDNVSIFEVRDGRPVYTGESLSVPAPVCVLF